AVPRSVSNHREKLSIPSSFSATREVQKRILHAIAAGGFGTESAFAVKLALEEGFNNAVRHGNKLDPKKKVHVEYKVTPKQAEIVIEDEGGGFDRCCVPDPTLEENLTKCSGRGILLIEAYMTKVQFSKGGRRLKMVRKNQG